MRKPLVLTLIIMHSNSKSQRRGRRCSSSLTYEVCEPRLLLAPVVGNDHYSSFGNTFLQLSDTGVFSDLPSVKITGSLFDNDDPGVSLDSFSPTSEQGATIEVMADGSFTYSPVEGVSWLTDSFSYSVSDGNETSRGVVSIELREMVWYVDNAAVDTGIGTSDNPFQSLDSVGFGGPDEDFDTIYVSSSETPYGSVDLSNWQRLIGAGVPLVVNGIQLAAASEQPTLEAPFFHALFLRENNYVSGVHLKQNQDEPVIRSFGVGRVLLEQVTIEGTGTQAGIEIQTNNPDSNRITILDSEIKELDRLLANSDFRLLNLAHNRFENVLSPVEVDGENRPDWNPSIRVSNNHFTQEEFLRFSDRGTPWAAISFSNLTLEGVVDEVARNTVENRLTGLYFFNVEFDDFSTPGWINPSGIEIYDSRGQISFDRVAITATTDVMENQPGMLVWDNNGDGHELDLTLEDFRYTAMQSPTEYQFNIQSGLQLSNLNSLTIDRGTFHSQEAKFSIRNVLHADVSLDEIFINSRFSGSSVLTISEVGGQVTFSNRVFTSSNARLDNMAIFPLVTLRNSNVTFDGYVGIRTENAANGGHGIYVESGNFTSDDPIHEVVFNNRVEVSTFRGYGIRFAGGKTVFNDFVSSSQHETAIEFRHEGWAALASIVDLRSTDNPIIEFNGGFRAEGNGQFGRAIMLKAAHITTGADNNDIFSRGETTNGFNGLLPGSQFSIRDIITPHAHVIFWSLNELDEVPALTDTMSITGDIRTPQLDVRISDQELNMTSRTSRVDHFYVNSTGSIVFDGQVITKDRFDKVFITTPFNRPGELDVTFNNQIVANSDFDISSAEKIFVENVSNVSFNAPIKIGQEATVREGIEIRNSNVQFNQSLTIDATYAITAVGGDKPTSVSLNDYLINAQKSAFFFLDIEHVSSNGGSVFFDSPDVDDFFAGIQFTNVHADFDIDHVSSTNRESEVIRINGMTGRFRVLGNGNEDQGGDHSGGSISGQQAAAIQIENAENITLRNLNINNNSGPGILINNVANFQLLASRIVENGDSPSEHGLDIENGTGLYRVIDSVIANNAGNDLVATNRLDTELDLLVDNSRFGGGNTAGSRSVVVSAYARSEVSARIVDSQFFSTFGEHITARSNGAATLDFSVNNNQIRDFRRGIGIWQRGFSQLDFVVNANSIIGRSDLSSKNAISAIGQSNDFGLGQLNGKVLNHSDTRKISRTTGVRFELKGHTFPDGFQIGSIGNFEFSRNLLEDYTGFGGVQVVANGANSKMEFVALSNTLSSPTNGNSVGFRFATGQSTFNNPLEATITLKSNLSTGGAGERAAGYQLIQENEASLILTAPAGNVAIGRTFDDSDGGVLMSSGVAGNNNQNLFGQDVSVRGEIEIVEE